MLKLISTAPAMVVVVMMGVVSAPLAKAEEPACIANFTSSGGFLKGREFKTWQDFADVKKADAYQRIYTQLVKDGWKIGQSDKEIGVITAAQEVSYGAGKAAPMNFLIEQIGTGIKITETFSMSGGISASLKAIQKSFCSYMDAVTK